MDIQDLRKLVGQEQIDYQFLTSALNAYSRPRDKISSWLQSGELLRVKKGIYVFGKRIADIPYSLETLANLIYGPSAISLSYALSYYGLIPERVSIVTSVTPKRHKQFSTPVGNFTYTYLTLKKYMVGIELHTNASKQHFLIASPEKALCDQLLLIDKKIQLTSLTDIEFYLLEDLRIDEETLIKLSCKKLKEIATAYQNKKIDMLLKYRQKIGR